MPMLKRFVRQAASLVKQAINGLKSSPQLPGKMIRPNCMKNLSSSKLNTERLRSSVMIFGLKTKGENLPGKSMESMSIWPQKKTVRSAKKAKSHKFFTGSKPGLAQERLCAFDAQRHVKQLEPGI